MQVKRSEIEDFVRRETNPKFGPMHCKKCGLAAVVGLCSDCKGPHPIIVSPEVYRRLKGFLAGR